MFTLPDSPADGAGANACAPRLVARTLSRVSQPEQPHIRKGKERQHCENQQELATDPCPGEQKPLLPPREAGRRPGELPMPPERPFDRGHGKSFPPHSAPDPCRDVRPAAAEPNSLPQFVLAQEAVVVTLSTGEVLLQHR